MEWVKFVLVVATAGTVSTLTDYVFTGGWMQKRFTDSSIWREKHAGILGFLASLLPFFTCAVFAYAANRLAVRSVHAAVKLAAVIWTIGPLPLILNNAVFLKMRPAYVLSYAISWIVKLALVAFLVGRFLA
jgi:hypothetical protein